MSRDNTKMTAEYSPIHAYMRDINQYKLVSTEEEKELAAQIAQGSAEAFNKLVMANLRLVVRIAHNYKRHGQLDDLISAGNSGLMTAVRKFDPHKGAKFSSYAAWWIKQNIRDFLVRDHVIRIPINMVMKFKRIRETTEQLTQELGRIPTDEEVGEKIGLTQGSVEKSRGQGNRTFSLDATVAEDSDTTCFNLIVGEEDMPLDRLVESEYYVHLEKLVNKLDKRSKHIITHRFGLKGREAKTLEEVSDDLGITRERVRQIQNNVLTELRRSLLKME